MLAACETPLNTTALIQCAGAGYDAMHNLKTNLIWKLHLLRKFNLT